MSALYGKYFSTKYLQQNRQLSMFSDGAGSHLTISSPLISNTPTVMVFDVELDFCGASWKCLCSVVVLLILMRVAQNRNEQTCQMSTCSSLFSRWRPVLCAEWLELSAIVPLWTSHDQRWWLLAMSTWSVVNYDGLCVAWFGLMP